LKWGSQCAHGSRNVIDYDWLIVGSGFGGSASALRLAEKGYQVAVLEAGRRYRDEDYAKTTWNLTPTPPPQPRLVVPGDTYLGSKVQTYVDPDDVGPDIEFHHMGHQNMSLVIEELNRMFTKVPKMLVGGCSAGGVGSLNNYPFIRNGIEGVEQSYLLADSGPIVPATLPNGQPRNQQGPSAATWAGMDMETNAGIVTYEGKYQVCPLDSKAYDPALCR